MERHPIFMDWKANIVRMAVIPKLTHRFNTIPLCFNSCWFPYGNGQVSPKIHMAIQGIQYTK